MYSKGAMNAGAVNAQKDTIWNTGPAGVFSCTVKTYLKENKM